MWFLKRVWLCISNGMQEILPYAAGGWFGQYTMWQKNLKRPTENLAHMGTHLKVLNKSYPMNTNMTGFRWFSKRFCILVLWTKVAFRALFNPSKLKAQGRSVTSIYYFDLFMSVVLKTAGLFCWYFAYKSNIQNIFEGEFFIKTLSTTLLQIVCELLLHSEVIFKIVTDPDDTQVLVDFQA